MDMLIGFGIGIGVTALVAAVFVMGMVRWLRYTRRRFPSMDKWLSIQARASTRRYFNLYKKIGSLEGPVNITVEYNGGKALTPEQHGIVLLLNGVDVLVRKTNIDPVLIDQLIQHCMEYTIQATNPNHKPEPRDGGTS